MPHIATRDIPKQYLDRVFEQEPFLSKAEAAGLAARFSRSQQPVAATCTTVAPDQRFIKALMPPSPA